MSMLSTWRYVSTRPPILIKAWRARHLTALRRAPRSVILTPITPAPRWTLFFAFCPDGKASDDQRETMALLRRLGRPICLVCASLDTAMIPPALAAHADAMIWKATDGWDFSAYALGLHAIAAGSAGADVLVMNDSIAGPFGDFAAMIDDAPWELTGFTASGIAEDHVQTYAFHLAAVTPTRLAALRTVLLPRWSFATFSGVVAWQETRLARVAARTMTVGAYWYDAGDPAINQPFALADAGFPFVKQSLSGKFAECYDMRAVADLLARQRLSARPLD